MILVSYMHGILSCLRRGISWFFPLAGPEYQHFKKLIIPTSRGTSEIDHLNVSQFGLFVVELKHRSGWIFGDETSPFWTAVHFRNRYRFQNPLHQNYGHLKALQEVLGIGLDKMFPIVVFRGRFEFKTPVPNDVLFDDYASWVVGHKEVILDPMEVTRIVSRIEEVRVRGWFAGWRHAKSVRERYESTEVCPKCNGKLVPRVARKGSAPGSCFLGCSNFPRCKYVKSLDDS